MDFLKYLSIINNRGVRGVRGQVSGDRYMAPPFREFVGAMYLSPDTSWRLCASSRLANHRSVFHNRQPFQENVNEIRNAVNDIRKTVNYIRKKAIKCQLKLGKDTTL